MRSSAVVSLVAVMGLALVSGAAAATSHVTINDNYFSPAASKIAVGDSVHWMRSDRAADTHNVREDNRIFRSGDPTPGDIDFARSFSAGTYHYYCEGHGARSGKGMDGFVRVPVTLDPGPAGAAFAVRWATSATNTGTRFDVQYRIGAGAWRAWKNGVSAFGATFGASDPVTAKAGTRYTFRARSLKGSAASRWSPVASIVP